MPGLDQLIGNTFGPYPVVPTRERAEAFLHAIGGDPAHDPAQVHPMFANVALFAVAPAFLDDDRARPYTTSLIHSEQTFDWTRPIPVGTPVEVTGTVQGVRARGALNFVNFAFQANTPNGIWLSGSSVFLMSQEAAAAAQNAGEPAEDDRPPFDAPSPATELPAEGGGLESVRCGASRVDLMRYAAASGDWNPIHFDHDSARRAGLEGVIVHGLLMAAWLGRVAARYGSLSTMKLRFRNPLRPSVAAIASGSVVAADETGAELDLSLTADDVRLVTSRVSVTR